MKKIVLTLMITALGFVVCFGQISDRQWLNLNYAGNDKEVALLSEAIRLTTLI